MRLTSLMAVSLMILASTVVQAQSHKGLTFQGFLKDSSGAVVTASGVTITSRLVSPNGCVLLQETHSGVNLVDGFFTVVIGKGVRGGSDRGLSLKEVFSNSANRTALDPVTGTAGSCNYTPTSNDARTVALDFAVGADSIKADFNVRANAFAVWAESSEDSAKLDGKAASAFLQTNSGVGLTQSKLEEFVQSLTSVTGGAVRWNGANFVSYNPSDASYLSSNSVTDTHIQSVAWSKLSAVPSGLTQIGGLSCADGKILKRVSGSWACADDDSGGGGGGSGDATSIHGASIQLSSPSNGQVLKYNGSQWVNAADGDLLAGFSCPDGQILKRDSGSWTCAAMTVAISDVTGLSTQLGNKLDQSQMPASCAANQTLHYTSVTDTWTCSNIDSLNASRVTAGVFDIARIPTGSTSTTVAIGNDGRFPSGDCGSGNKMRFTSGSWICEADASTDSTKVAKSGDTMTGALNLPSNGLAVGTDQLVVSGGNVGIGTATPAAAALLEMASTSKGFLPPQMTTAQRDAIGAPIAGLVVYNSTNGRHEYYDGSAWGAMGGLPNGTIAAFASASCPGGWIEYTAARGRFLRGIDNGAGHDPEGTRAPGSTQADAFQGHHHQSLFLDDSAGFSAGSGMARVSANPASNVNPIANVSSPTSDGTNGTPRTASETRPKNVAVLYCQYVGGTLGFTPPDLSAIGGVDVSSPVNGQSLIYNSTSSKWENQTVVSGQWTPAGSDIYRNTGNVGIGTDSPGEKLEVSGAVKIGAASAAADGTIRWTGTDFEGRKGGAWVSLTTSASGGGVTALVALTSGSGNWTVPAGVTKIKVTVTGGGGGGYPSSGNDGYGGCTSRGGAGSGGGTAIAVLTVTPGDQIAYSVGTGGGSNSDGTASTFGALTGDRGLKGINEAGSPAGGAATGGMLNIPGEPPVRTYFQYSQIGGRSHWGIGGAVGVNAGAYGSGGGMPACNSGGSAGRTGAPGIIMIEY